MAVWLNPTRPYFPLSLPVRYHAEYSQITSTEWMQFAEYYLQRRGLSREATSEVLKDSKVLEPTPATELQLSRLQNDVQHRDLLGQLGEILTTFVLETQNGMFTYKLTWPDRPFAVIKGLDLAGVCLKSWLVALAEIKATGTTDLTSQLAEARDDLKCARLVPRYQIDFNDGRSRRSAIIALRRAIRDGRLTGLTIRPENLEQLLDPNRFIRIGAIIHPTLASRYNYKQTLKILQNDDLEHYGHSGCLQGEREAKSHLPTVIIDLDIEDCDQRIKEWAQLEQLLIASESGST